MNIDYHIAWKGHYYSVPHQLVKQEVDIQVTEYCITISAKGKTVARHARKHQSGFTTLSARTIAQPGVRSQTGCALDTHYVLESREHPEQAYRSCLGLLNLKRDFGTERLNNACGHARHIKGYLLKSIRAILTSGKDLQPIEAEAKQTTLALHEDHENVRGADCFN